MSSGKEAQIPKTHPRYKSLLQRHMLEEAMHNGIVAPAGLTAHGRGEAFDYLIGERTTKNAKGSIRAAAAELLLAERPVLCVNGNTSALCAREIISLRKAVPNSAIEVNLFYRSRTREIKIKKLFSKLGEKILGADPKMQTRITGLDSARRIVDARGVKNADTVLVMLEDGDRTEALRKLGKRVIAIDLNPLSRTAKKADITIVDNVCRALPLLTKEVRNLKKCRGGNAAINSIKARYSNKKALDNSLKIIRGGAR
ncbi:MAG: phosphopantothenate/pantothenate synthetase [Candidatus Diapherotrites archaeon]